LTFKEDTCHGGKKSKERVTVMVGANTTGTQKLKLLLIGKSKNIFDNSNFLFRTQPISYRGSTVLFSTSFNQKHSFFKFFLHKFLIWIS